jgi:hypothetical protein
MSSVNPDAILFASVMSTLDQVIHVLSRHPVFGVTRFFKVPELTESLSASEFLEEF